MRNLIRVTVGILAALVMAAPAAHAQGCVLCYTSLAGLGSGAQRAFELAMFALLVPALLLFAGVFFFIYLRAQSAGSDEVGMTKAGFKVAVKPAHKPKFEPGIGVTAEGRV